MTSSVAVDHTLPPVPPSAVGVPRWRYGALAANDAGHSVARLARRRRRTAARVNAEYDEGVWGAVRADAAWERCATLEEFLVGASDEPIVARLHDATWSLPKRDYYRWRLEALQRILAPHAPDDGQLLELGCGFGTNLFCLALDARWSQLRGLDVSRSGIESGAKIAGCFGLDQVTFGAIDLTDPGHPGFAEVEGSTVLTYFCLEQLPADVGTVIETLVAHRPRRVIHVESAAGMLGLTRPVDALNRLYLRSMDYQRHLVPIVQALAQRGVVRLRHRERLTFGPSIHNDPCLLVWEPA